MDDHGPAAEVNRRQILGQRVETGFCHRCRSIAECFDGFENAAVDREKAKAMLQDCFSPALDALVENGVDGAFR